MKNDGYYADKYFTREKFMSEKEMKEVDDRITKLTLNRGNMSDLYARWEYEEKVYKGDQDKVPNRPNTRVNIVNANIEGQVSVLVDQNIAVATRGESPADKEFAEWARIGLEWSFRKNRIKKIIEVHERRRLKFGVGLLKVQFDDSEINGFGLAKVTTPPLTKVFIDNKIKDPLRFQEADYMCETIRLSRTAYEELYGEEKASAIKYGRLYLEDVSVFHEDDTIDDNDGATLIQWYEKYKGKLRLLEFTADGLLLYDSCKKGDRETNQKGFKVESKPLYKYVNNKYPYFFTPLYPEEGQLFGFGDCKLLTPIQDMINDLYDKIRIAARPNLILFDPSSEVDLEDFNENSYEARPAMLDRNAVQIVPWGTVNPSLWQLISSMHQEAQRVTRYSDLMIGQGRSSETATEATIQQTQGNNTTDYKKRMLEETLVEVGEYMLGLMMEFYKGAKAFRIADDKDEYEWIDFRKLAKVPVMKPASRSFIKQFTEKNPTYSESPQWEILTDDDNNPLTKNIDLDLEITIGAGLPKNKGFMWNMLRQLAAIVVLDEQGVQHNLISYEELRKFVKEYIGLPIEDSDLQEQQPLMQQQPTPGGQAPAMNPNAPLSANGNPSPSALTGQ